MIPHDSTITWYLAASRIPTDFPGHACVQDIDKLEEASKDPQDTAAALLNPALQVQQQNMDQCVRCATVDNFQGERSLWGLSCRYTPASLVPSKGLLLAAP